LVASRMQIANVDATDFVAVRADMNRIIEAVLV